MRIVTKEEITKLMPAPKDCVAWVEEVLKHKSECILPPKISLHFEGHTFFNTMPAALPFMDRIGLKEVSRIPGRNPSLAGDILLYELSSGRLLALMDGTLITEWRTGAVAAHSINLFQREGAKVFAMMGLGATAHTTLRCYLNAYPNHCPKTFKLLCYKNQAEHFATDFADDNLTFEIVDSVESLIRDSDVVVSCVTALDGPIAKDEWFKEGCTVVPVHTRGFQNCDLFFDKVFADDTGHVCHFGNFEKFRRFAEVAEVVTGKKAGRESYSERVLVYNIGVAIHDLYFASRILNDA